MNIPNALTLLRVALVPVFVALLLADQNRWLVLAVFLFAAATDLVDGWWARTRGEITDFGRLADPIADKALTGAAWLGLSWLGELPWLATALILIREIGITALRLMFADRVVQSADKGGKLKTALQVTTISLWLVFGNRTGIVGAGLYSLLWITTITTVYTGVRYLGSFWRALRVSAND